MPFSIICVHSVLLLSTEMFSGPPLGETPLRGFPECARLPKQTFKNFVLEELPVEIARPRQVLRSPAPQ